MASAAALVTAPNAAQKGIAKGGPRRTRLLLRDGGIVEGGLYLNDGQALAQYLSTRKGGWVNIVAAKWQSEAETHNHAVLQADHIFAALSEDADIPVYAAMAGVTLRKVDIGIDDGTWVHGMLQLAEKQRLSDYLSTCGKFMPVLAASRTPSGDELGDLALNCGCVKVVRDQIAFASGTMEVAADVSGEGAGAARGSAAIPVPVNRVLVQRETGVVEVITPGRIPDRRLGAANPWQPSGAPPAEKEPAVPELTADQRQLAEHLAKHWLVRLGVAVQLSPPDPREISAAPTLDEIWCGLSKRNDIDERELAIHVAAAFKLGVAELDRVTQDAVRVVPEKLARKLGVVPVTIDHRILELAISDPSSMEIEQQLGFVTKLALRFVIAPPSGIRGALDRHYGAAPGIAAAAPGSPIARS